MTGPERFSTAAPADLSTQSVWAFLEMREGGREVESVCEHLLRSDGGKCRTVAFCDFSRLNEECSGNDHGERIATRLQEIRPRRWESLV